MTNEPVLVIERRQRIALAVLNRPHTHNALDSELRGALTDFWVRVRDDDGIAAAIVTGAGDKAFSSGRDLKETAAAYDSGADGTDAEASARFGYPSDITVGKPIIAAINGYCLAAGLKLAAGCDIRIATAGSTFGNPQVAVGRGTEMPLRLLKLGVPRAVVLDMVLTGEPIDAAAALRWGLISRVVAAGELLDTAWSIAQTIVQNSPLIVNGIKRLVDDDIADLPMAEALAKWREAPDFFGATADAREGARSFADRRARRYG